MLYNQSFKKLFNKMKMRDQRLFPAADYMLIMMFIALPVLGQSQTAVDAESSIDVKVDSLLQLMTLEEKIGQLTLFTSDLTTTGPTIRDDYKKLINNGKAGAIFNAYGSEYTRKLQDMAVENSRLGIPLLFGYDVIHGFRTIFPIPLGEAASWDLELARESARVAPGKPLQPACIGPSRQWWMSHGIHAGGG